MAIVEKADIERFSRPKLEDRSLRYFRNHFASLFGPEWSNLEIETWVSEFRPQEVTPLLIAKMRLLKVMEENPDRFYEDPVFMLASLDILNGDLPDQDTSVLPEVTSLELAYGLDVIRDLYPSKDLHAVSVISKIILQNEGYHFVPRGFEDILDPADFTETEFSVKQDSKDKQKAMNTYLKLMELTDRA